MSSRVFTRLFVSAPSGAAGAATVAAAEPPEQRSTRVSTVDGGGAGTSVHQRSTSTTTVRIAADAAVLINPPMAKGASYVGEREDSLRHGNGSQTVPVDGFRRSYTGEWRADQMHGCGVLDNGAGLRYSGQFVRGEAHGFGAMVFTTASGGHNVLFGQLVHNKRHGWYMVVKLAPPSKGRPRHATTVEAIEYRDDEAVAAGVRDGEHFVRAQLVEKAARREAFRAEHTRAFVLGEKEPSPLYTELVKPQGSHSLYQDSVSASSRSLLVGLTETIIIIVKDLLGRQELVSISRETSVEALLRPFLDPMGLPLHTFSFSYFGDVMDPSLTLQTYDVEDGAVLSICLRQTWLLAGMAHGLFFDRVSLPRGFMYRGQVIKRPDSGIKVPHGWGIMTEPTGFLVQGYFENGKLNGTCAIIESTKASYLGRKLQDKRDGYGVWSDASGKRYEGEFFDDQFNGYGIFYGTRDKLASHFVDGKPVQSEAFDKTLIDEMSVVAAQRAQDVAAMTKLVTRLAQVAADAVDRDPGTLAFVSVSLS